MKNQDANLSPFRESSAIILSRRMIRNPRTARISRRIICFFGIFPALCECIYGVSPVFDGFEGFCFCVAGDDDAVSVEAYVEGVVSDGTGDSGVPECFVCFFGCGCSNSADGLCGFGSFEEGDAVFVCGFGGCGEADFSCFVSCGVEVGDFCGVADASGLLFGEPDGFVVYEGGYNVFEGGKVSNRFGEFSFRRHGDCGLGEIGHFLFTPEKGASIRLATRRRKKAVWFLRDREGAFFLLPLFSTIILDAGGDKLVVGLRFFGILCVENVLLGFGHLMKKHILHRRSLQSPRV